MNHSVPTRDTCFWDEYYIYRNQLKFKPNFQISATYSSALTVEQIFNALTLLLQQHLQWSLQVFPKNNNEGSVNNKSKKYEFRPIKEYKLSDVVQIKSSKDISLKEVLLSLTHSAFELSNDEKPLWSLILYDSNTLIFYADHLLGDGNSYKNFQLELLRLLNDNPNIETNYKYEGFESIVYKYSDSLVQQISPAYNEIIDCTVSWSYLTSKLFKHFLPYVYYSYLKLKPKNKFEKLMSGEQLVIEELSLEQDYRLEYHLNLLNIPLEKVSKLIEICRNHQVKLTSLLYTICLLSFLPITKDKDTIGSAPVNIRKLIDINKANQLCTSFSDKFGLYIGQAEVNLPALNKLKHTETGQQIDWEVVQYIHKVITGQIDSAYEPIAMLQLVDIEDYVTNSIKVPRTSTFELSNLGSVSQNPESKFKIIDMVFNQPPGKNGSIFCCNVLGTEIGGVNLSLTGIKSLSLEEFEIYTNGVKNWIDLVVSK